jgi:hypothetical protein
MRNLLISAAAAAITLGSVALSNSAASAAMPTMTRFASPFDVRIEKVVYYGTRGSARRTVRRRTGYHRY